MAKLIVNYGGTAPRASLRVFNSVLFITRPKMRSEQPLICVVLHSRRFKYSGVLSKMSQNTSYRI